MDLARSISPKVPFGFSSSHGIGEISLPYLSGKQREGQVNQIGVALLGADSMLKRVIVVNTI